LDIINSRRYQATVAILLGLAFGDVSTADAQTQTQAQVKEFHVPTEAAVKGIPEFARQAGIQTLVSEPLVRDKQTAEVTGTHSIDEAFGL